MSIPRDRVKCMECGMSLKCVEYSHLSHKHGMDIDQYEEKYPNSPRISINTLERLGRFEEAFILAAKNRAGLLDYGTP